MAYIYVVSWKNHQVRNDVATQPERDNINFLQIIRFYYKSIFVCFVAVVFFNVTNYMVTAYLPTYLEQVIKLDATTTSVLITCVMAIMIPLALMFGKLADKIGEKKVFLIGTGGLTLFSIIAFMLLHSQSFVVNHNRYIYIRIFLINLRSDNARVVTNDVLQSYKISNFISNI